MVSATDIIALPADLIAAFGKRYASRVGITIYRGVVVEEKSQAWHKTESQSGRTVAEGLARELWLKLPSGTEKRWALDNNSFGVRVGNRVSVLSMSHKSNDLAIVLVNHETGERYIAWDRNTSIRWQLLYAFLTVLFIDFPFMRGLMFVAFVLSVCWRIYDGRDEKRLQSDFERAAQYMIQSGPA